MLSRCEQLHFPPPGAERVDGRRLVPSKSVHKNIKAGTEAGNLQFQRPHTCCLKVLPSEEVLRDGEAYDLCLSEIPALPLEKARRGAWGSRTQMCPLDLSSMYPASICPFVPPPTYPPFHHSLPIMHSSISSSLPRADIAAIWVHPPGPQQAGTLVWSVREAPREHRLRPMPPPHSGHQDAAGDGCRECISF